jgi:uncharacterized protein YndB with AHSA1/START domain
MSRTIELTRTTEASPERVFRAWTDADELNRWWTTTAESDARTGGTFSYGFEFADASRNHTYTGTYHDVSPGERVSFPWQGALGETTVDVRLEPASDGTKITLLHTGWGEGAEWDEAVALHEQGWSFFLDNLVAYLDRGEDLRLSGPMQQRVVSAQKT